MWINFVPYAKRLFAGHEEDLWKHPGRFLSVYSQAQGLLQSDVLSLHIHDFYQAFLGDRSDLMEQWQGKKTTFALKKVLAMEEPRSTLLEVLTGLVGLYADRHPIVLIVPSPQRFLQWVKTMVSPGGEPVIGSHEMDAASMYMADFLRTFSNSKLAGIVLEETYPTASNLKETLELYQPISNLAEHYQWAFGLHLADLQEDVERLKEKVDFVLYEGDNWSSLDQLWKAGMASGGGLDRAFWSGNVDSENRQMKGLAYGTIPEDAHPEKVLEQLQKLRLSS